MLSFLPLHTLASVLFMKTGTAFSVSITIIHSSVLIHYFRSPFLSVFFRSRPRIPSTFSEYSPGDIYLFAHPFLLLLYSVQNANVLLHLFVRPRLLADGPMVCSTLVGGS